MENNEIEIIESNSIDLLSCGVIMPIADNPDYPNGHWVEVLDILKSALDDTNFQVNLVSESLDVGLIHERIIKNIYKNDIVICDVSSKNPNVMFELGMRLAFDKPTIIIKDDKTPYTFDTQVIEHISYPSSLRHKDINNFKKNLKTRVLATYEKFKSEPNFSPFLRAFGREVIPSQIPQSQINDVDFLKEQLLKINNRLNLFSHTQDSFGSNTIPLEIRRNNLMKRLRVRNPSLDYARLHQALWNMYPSGIEPNFLDDEESLWNIIKNLIKYAGIQITYSDISEALKITFAI